MCDLMFVYGFFCVFWKCIDTPHYWDDQNRISINIFIKYVKKCGIVQNFIWLCTMVSLFLSYNDKFIIIINL